ncbi:MAG: hypothetical protein ACFFED_17025 [Candidatus Thorarchaeota archaeon]
MGKKHAASISVIITLAVIAPLLAIQITGLGMPHTGKIDLTTSVLHWFNGTMILECDDGYTERIYIRYPDNLPPLGPDELVQTGSLVNRDFTKSTLCTLTFSIPVLGLTLGPFQFQSYQSKILYQDDDENMIEWVVMESQANDMSNSRMSCGFITCFSDEMKRLPLFDGYENLASRQIK